MRRRSASTESTTCCRLVTSCVTRSASAPFSDRPSNACASFPSSADSERINQGDATRRKTSPITAAAQALVIVSIANGPSSARPAANLEKYSGSPISTGGTDHETTIATIHVIAIGNRSS